MTSRTADQYNGGNYKTLSWEVFWDTALPSWLVLTGTGSVAFSTVSNSRGVCTLTTQAVDQAVVGIALANSIQMSSFREIQFAVESIALDANATASKASLSVYLGDNTSTGIQILNNTTKVFPDFSVNSYFDPTGNGNGPKRKGLGFKADILKKQVDFYSGDPFRKGLPYVSTPNGELNAVTAPAGLQLKAIGAEARSVSFSRVVARLFYD